MADSDKAADEAMADSDNAADVPPGLTQEGGEADKKAEPEPKEKEGETR
jgi:hypothetical protein